MNIVCTRDTVGKIQYPHFSVAVLRTYGIVILEFEFGTALSGVARMVGWWELLIQSSKVTRALPVDTLGRYRRTRTHDILFASQRYVLYLGT